MNKTVSWQELWLRAKCRKKIAYIAHMVFILSGVLFLEVAFANLDSSKPVPIFPFLIVCLAFLFSACGGWRSIVVNIVLAPLMLFNCFVAWGIATEIRNGILFESPLPFVICIILLAFDFAMLHLIQFLLGMYKKPEEKITFSSVKKSIENYIEGVLKAAVFSTDTQNHFSNSKRAARWSFLLPFILLMYVSFLFCSTHKELVTGPFQGSFTLFFIISLIFELTIIAPKFMVFLGLTWQLCKACRQTDYFWAFVTATNWYYFIYALILMAQAVLSHIFHIQFDHWEKVLAGYFTIVVYFLAQNILRMTQEYASLVGMAFVLTHILIWMITTKHGLMVVF